MTGGMSVSTTVGRYGRCADGLLLSWGMGRASYGEGRLHDASEGRSDEPLKRDQVAGRHAGWDNKTQSLVDRGGDRLRKTCASSTQVSFRLSG